MGKERFQILKKKQLLQTPYFNVVEEVIEPEGGKEINYVFIKHPGSCVVVPMTSEGKVIMINQYRHPIRANSLEVVAGGLENNELIENAKRELEEEIGYQCRDLIPLGQFFASNSCSDEKVSVFLARRLTRTKSRRGKTEHITEVSKIGLERAIRQIVEGEITDAHTIIALFMTQEYLSRKE